MERRERKTSSLDFPLLNFTPNILDKPGMSVLFYPHVPAKPSEGTVTFHVTPGFDDDGG